MNNDMQINVDTAIEYCRTRWGADSYDEFSAIEILADLRAGRPVYGYTVSGNRVSYAYTGQTTHYTNHEAALVAVIEALS